MVVRDKQQLAIFSSRRLSSDEKLVRQKLSDQSISKSQPLQGSASALVLAIVVNGISTFPRQATRQAILLFCALKCEATTQVLMAKSSILYRHS